MFCRWLIRTHRSRMRMLSTVACRTVVICPMWVMCRMGRGPTRWRNSASGWRCCPACQTGCPSTVLTRSATGYRCRTFSQICCHTATLNTMMLVAGGSPEGV
ncbi:Uncharacterised protein [Mycobacteroides abscessus subsp. abscessus]|nr:Uncharacterised protein [Mycobacteroides abscessus subsp. abscessus]